MLLIQKAHENQRLYLIIMQCKGFIFEKRKHKFECEVETDDFSRKYRNKNIDKIRQKDKERNKFEREYVKYCDKKKYDKNGEKTNEERDSLRKHQPEKKLKLKKLKSRHGRSNITH